MKVKLVAITQLVETMKQELPVELHSPEGLIAYTARVSSEHQDNPDYEKLLKYCLDHGHYSVFETVNMTVEIETSVMIAPQILRHRSATFQQFSARYAKVQDFETYQPRKQDSKNRQNSTDDLTEETKEWFLRQQDNIQSVSKALYDIALEKGVAKECARGLLPQSASTKLYMTNNIRNWIFYIKTRTDPSTQLEHREIAEEIKKIFIDNFPIISRGLGWKM